MIYSLFCRHNSFEFFLYSILGQQLLFKRKHRGVHPLLVSYQFMVTRIEKFALSWSVRSLGRIPANLWRSKIWRLSILLYTPPPPNVNSTNTATPTPPRQQIALGRYMTSYMKYMESKCADELVFVID